MKNGLVIRESGTKLWYKNDQLHRIDGPAAIYMLGYKGWYFNGRGYREEDHPFNVFRKEHMLSEIYNDWPNDMKMLFKLTYG